MKICCICKINKATKYFYKNSNKKDGLRSACKDCENKKRKSRYNITKNEIKITPEYKICSICKIKKISNEFRKDRSRKDGLSYRCKDCMSIKDKIRYKNNIEKERERANNYRKENPEKIKEYQKNHYKENPDYYKNKRDIRRALEKDATIGELSSRREIYERDNKICQICGEYVEWDDLHIDHIVPYAKQGEHSDINRQTTHSWCNLRKGTKLMSELW